MLQLLTKAECFCIAHKALPEVEKSEKRIRCQIEVHCLESLSTNSMQIRYRQLFLLLFFCLFLFWIKSAFFDRYFYQNLVGIISSTKNNDQDYDYRRFRRKFDNEWYVANSSFSPESDIFLKELKLMNEDLLTNGSDEAEENEEKRILESSPIFVTAFSDNHFHEALNMMKSIEKLYKEKIVVVYDIGLSKGNVQSLKQKFASILLSVKKFPFEIYPKFVSNLFEYRWKPLIIARELNHRPSIIWIDSSTIHHKHLQYILKYYENCTLTGKLFAECTQYPWHLFDFVKHSIFAATKAGMFDFLPMPNDMSYNITMIGANIQLIFGLRQLKKQILRYWVLCAVEEKCMAPPGSVLHCDFKNDSYTRFAECHRFDQSAVNILLAWANGFRLDRYYNPVFDSVFEPVKSG